MNQLRKIREEMGITQIEAANICGVSRRTYQYYENEEMNKALDSLLASLITSMDEYLNPKIIKDRCFKVFKKYPEIRCAYLYGSYARNQATKKSDVDILVVLDKPMGMRYFAIASDLEDVLHKSVDMQSYEQLLDNASMLKDILVEGIKIYG